MSQFHLLFIASRSFIYPKAFIQIFTLHAALLPLCPHLTSPVGLIVKVLVSIMLKCTSHCGKKPPSDMESTHGKDYTTHENELVNVNVRRGINAPEFVLCSHSIIPRLWFFLYGMVSAASAALQSWLLGSPKTNPFSSPVWYNKVNSDLHSNSNFIPGIGEAISPH